MSFTYVSIPYSDPEFEVRQSRMRSFWQAVAMLTRAGERVVSPMALEPMLAYDPTLTSDWDGWSDYSLRLLSICDKVVVVAVQGWEASTGVEGELAEAAHLALPVKFLWPHDLIRRPPHLPPGDSDPENWYFRRTSNQGD